MLNLHRMKDFLLGVIKREEHSSDDSSAFRDKRLMSRDSYKKFSETSYGNRQQPLNPKCFSSKCLTIEVEPVTSLQKKKKNYPRIYKCCIFFGDKVIKWI